MPETPQARHACGPHSRRRGTAIVASAAALCLGGGLLTGCGGGPDGDGYVAVGAAGSGPARSGGTGPSGKVTLVPLDGGGGGPDGSPSPAGPSSPATGPDAADAVTGGPAARSTGSGPTGGGSGSGAHTEAPGGSGAGTGPGGAPAPARPADPVKPSKPSAPSGPGSGATPSPPGAPKPGGGGGGTAGPPPPAEPAPPPPPPTPAALKLSAPQRTPAEKRWCEKVTVEFRNTGGSPARSGTVTFATHIIGALGVDWATIRSSQSLPTPIAAGATRSETYTVCVESWRVPLGMRVETQGVSAVWE
ncbi:hypothetical protein GTY67_16070 [Streptomyces sp. SID8374]|nr:hypothetical protein [Streptomyces sp. SID8374]MYX14889.1 hypothetical protein [Streptomyces sp. SID8374]